MTRSERALDATLTWLDRPEARRPLGSAIGITIAVTIQQAGVVVGLAMAAVGAVCLFLGMSAGWRKGR